MDHRTTFRVDDKATSKNKKVEQTINKDTITLNRDRKV